MAFINEYISAADMARYDIEAIDRGFFKKIYRHDWTVDHERNIYLRLLESGREDFANQVDYFFYWKGKLLIVRLEQCGGGVCGGAGWREYKLIKIDIPESLKEHRVDILKDLKDALVAYKDFGVRSVTNEHVATFDF